jgi:hypothetical protein
MYKVKITFSDKDVQEYSYDSHETAYRIYESICLKIAESAATFDGEYFIELFFDNNPVKQLKLISTK